MIEDIADEIYKELYPDKFGIDPILIASIISLIIQVIRLIYDYNHKQLEQDVKGVGLFRGIYLRYKFATLLDLKGIRCSDFYSAFFKVLKNQNVAHWKQILEVK